MIHAFIARPFNAVIRLVLLRRLLLIHFEHTAAMLHNTRYSEGGCHNSLLQTSPQVCDDQRLAEREANAFSTLRRAFESQTLHRNRL